MKLRSIVKIVAVAVMVSIAFSVVIAEMQIAAYIGHECPEREHTTGACFECLLIGKIIKTLQFAGVGFFLAAMALSSAKFHKKYSQFCFQPLSPIVLKTRMNT